MVAVIDDRMPCSAKARLKEICEVIELPPFSALDARVASHPDMLMFALDGKLFVCEQYYGEAKGSIDKIIQAADLELMLTNDLLGAQYPNDVRFNAFIINGAMIGNTTNISQEIRDYASGIGIVQASVKQGYAKCSTVVLDGAVISADNGICKAASELGIEALSVSAGGVELDGYDCGFIGGASGVCGKQVFFCGDITKHKDFESISAFCAAHGYEVISLSDEPLYDVGTILFFSNNNYQ